MELTFQSKPFHYLHNVLQDIYCQEETAEIIVPDSYPDISSIVDCCAEAILRGTDCRDGGVTVTGGLKGALLYAPEDGSSPKKMEVYIPFSAKFNDPAFSSHMQIICSVRVRSVDGRMINSRKALLRVNIGCEIAAYEQINDQKYTLETSIPELQTKEAEYITDIPLEMGEKAFTVSDTIDFLYGRPSGSQIYDFRCFPELTEEKLLGNKAVFRGVLHCKILYLSEEETLCLQEETLPFSQYCELSADYDEETVHTQLNVTEYDLEASATDDSRQLVINVNILAKCIVSGQLKLSLIEDAYCTRGLLQPQWKEYKVRGSLDRQTLKTNIRCHVPGTFRQVLDTQVYWDFPELIRAQDRTEIKIPAVIRVLGYDNDGMLFAQTVRTEASQEIMLAEKAHCLVSVLPSADIFASSGSGGIEVRCSIPLSVCCCVHDMLRTLCGGEIQPDEKPEEKRPTLIVRTVGKDTPLWDLAKSYRTATEQIAAVNHLDGPIVPTDTMLLLPIV